MVPVLLKTMFKDHEWFRDIKVVTVLSSDEPFFAFTEEALKRFGIHGNTEQLTNAEGFLKANLSASDAVIRLKSKKNGKLDAMLKHEAVRNILSDKKEHYRIFDINTSNNDIDILGSNCKRTI
ncbi:MAG: hypothetical protein U5N26_08825 [Candidatus Marinimicrobia bacterium]|nr:hypothetical protein [Candidatus Neomarinimicrobiota bacterium]